MKKIDHIPLHISFGLLVIFLSGCLSTKTDLLKSGSVIVEPIASKYVTFSRFSVHADDQEVVIYGKVGRAAGISSTLEGAVVVILANSDGGTIAEQRTSTFPKRIPIRRSRKSYFVARFPSVPQLKTIRVQYDFEKHFHELISETIETKS